MTGYGFGGNKSWRKSGKATLKGKKVKPAADKRPPTNTKPPLWDKLFPSRDSEQATSARKSATDFSHGGAETRREE